MTGGRDRFAAIALEHLARAVAADELGVAYREVSARVRDSAGELEVRVTSPVAVAPLATGSAEPLTTRLGEAAGTIRARLDALTGLAFARVDVRAARATILNRRTR